MEIIKKEQIKDYVNKNLLNQDDFEFNYFEAIGRNLNYQECKNDIVCNSHGAALMALEQAREGLEMIKLHVLNSLDSFDEIKEFVKNVVNEKLDCSKLPKSGYEIMREKELNQEN